MKQRLYQVLLLLMVAALAWLAFKAGRGDSVKIHITQAMIDEALAKKFPKQKTYLKVVRVTYANPKASLLPDQNKVLVSLEVSVNMGIKGFEKSFKGAAAVATRVRYNTSDFKFYLEDPELLSVDIPKLSDTELAHIRDGLNLIASEFVSEVPIYKLTRNDTHTRLTRLLLKDLTFQKNKVVVTLGL
jgi:hypothetical protein